MTNPANFGGAEYEPNSQDVLDAAYTIEDSLLNQGGRFIRNLEVSPGAPPLDARGPITSDRYSNTTAVELVSQLPGLRIMAGVRKVLAAEGADGTSILELDPLSDAAYVCPPVKDHQCPTS